jgi:hypothetical protein
MLTVAHDGSPANHTTSIRDHERAPNAESWEQIHHTAMIQHELSERNQPTVAFKRQMTELVGNHMLLRSSGME